MIKKMKLNRSREGFSLVEIIIVIAIAAILIGVIALAVIPNIKKSKESKDLQKISGILSAATVAVGNAHIETDSRTVIKLSPSSGYAVPNDETTNGGPEGFKKAFEDAMSGSITLESGAATGKDINIVIDGKNLEVIVGGTDKAHAASCEVTQDDKGSGGFQLFYVSN